MKTVRRLYFFLVAFISLEVVLWGLIGLLRTIFSRELIFPSTDVLAQALSLILVGVPIFWIHWRWAQHAAGQDVEEQTSTLRAVFLYGSLLATLIPTVQNVLAFITRTFFQVGGLSVGRAYFGGQQTWVDNLIAIALNLAAAWYFWSVLQASWRTLPEKDNFADVRRLYRYIWVLYGLLMTAFGVQQVLQFIFHVPSFVLGEPGREMFGNGFALLLIGIPVWLYNWNLCQVSPQDDPAEQHSMLRLGVLYLLSLFPAVVTLFAGGFTLDLVFRQVLGDGETISIFLQQFGNTLAVLIPMAMLWAYHNLWRGREIETYEAPTRQSALNRLYGYVLSLFGLGAVMLGLGLLLSLLIDLLLEHTALWGDSFIGQLAGGLAVLLVGLPIWLLHWMPLQAEALSANEAGDHARQSVVRRVALYLVIFVCVIGGMVSAGLLIYQLLNAVLGGESIQLIEVFNSAQALLIFTIFLVYHFNALKTDGSQSAEVLAGRLSQFAVLVFEQEGSGFGAPVAESIRRTAPLVPVAVQAIEQGMPEDAHLVKAVVLPSTLALDPPEALRLWLKDFEGGRVVAPVQQENWHWAGQVSQRPGEVAAQMVRSLAQGEPVRATGGASALQVVIYIFAALFAIQLLFFLLILGISLVAGPF